MVRHLFHVINMEMARTDELPMITMYISYLYQLSCVNQDPTAYSHCSQLGVPVNLEDMSNAPAEFNQLRRNFPAYLKLYFDQLEYFAAMTDVFKGLRRFTQVC